MKGIVFTEFMDMVDEKFGMEMSESLISECELPSGGAYTAVGTYDDSEMLSLVAKLSEKTESAISDLLFAFGQFLYARFKSKFGHFFSELTDPFSLLESVEEHIHVEVKKLYPEAILPSLETHRVSEMELTMIYRSSRNLPDLAHGLIDACMIDYDNKSNIQRAPVESEPMATKFIIKR